MSKVKKYTVTIDYEVTVSEDYKPTLKCEREIVNKEAFGDTDVLSGPYTEVTRVHVAVRK